MKNKIIMLALLALAFQVQAIPVTQSQAALAARAWVRRGGMLGAKIGNTVLAVKTQVTTDGAPYHVVQMTGGGTVITSGDTEVEPVVLFSGETIDEVALDENGPLYALLNSDLSKRTPESARIQPVQVKNAGPKLMATAPATATSSSAAPAVGNSRNAKAWSQLIAEGTASLRTQKLMAANPTKVDPGDLRVGALVKSKWNQDWARGMKCYNYYTPNNYVCGCVATATAQLMRYYHGPATDDEQFGGGLGIPLPEKNVYPYKRECVVDSVRTNLMMQGGTYAWDAMPLVPAAYGSLTEAHCQNIGKLTSDFGIAIYMDYSISGSGSFNFNQSKVLTEVFGYKQAIYYTVDNGKKEIADNSAALTRSMFANFDAGCPVLLGISMTGKTTGHAIIADGYGYNDSIPYVHLNMGWAGSDDMWYNLPNMLEAGYDTIDGLTYNIFPDKGSVDMKTGKTSAAVISGRVLDEDGKGYGACTVEICKAGDYTPIAKVSPSELGVWGAVIEPGLYDIQVMSDDRERGGEVKGIEVRRPDTYLKTWNNKFENIVTVAGAENLGNSWGNDITLEPLVFTANRIRPSEEPVAYLTLSRALAEATTNDTLQVIAPSRLDRSETVSFDCCFERPEDAVAAVRVLRPNGETLTIATNVTVVFSNFVFAAASKAPIVVELGGCAAFMGKVCEEEFLTVKVADENGFALAGDITGGIVVDCATASGEGDVFGLGLTNYCDLATARRNAAKLVHPTDDALGGEAFEENGVVRFRWARVDVDPEAAVATRKGEAGKAVYSRRLDKMMAGLSADADITVLKNCSISGEIPVDFKVTLSSSATLPCKVWPKNDAIVKVRSALTVTDLIVCDNDRCKGVFLVDGGNLTLGKGASLRNMTRYVTSKDEPVYGPLAVLRGTLTMRSGAEITGCRADMAPNLTEPHGYGGGVWLNAGAVFDMQGGLIADCHAKEYGGGIYANGGATVRISGDAEVRGNTSGDSGVADNVYLRGKTANFIVGELKGVQCVGVRYGSGAASRNGTNGVFAVVKEGVDITNLEAFVCDVNKGLMATNSVDGKSLCWYSPYAGDGPMPVEPAVAVARTLSDGRIAYWASVSDAFKSLPSDAKVATVEIVKDDTFDEDIEVKCNVTLRTAEDAEGVRVLTRAEGARILVPNGGSLTVEGVCFSGGGEAGGMNRLFSIDGGSLLIKDTMIYNVFGGKTRGDAGVVVWNGGQFEMDGTSVVAFCENAFKTDDPNAGAAGGLIVEGAGSRAVLKGGVVTGCFAHKAGGVFVGNEAEICISGDVVIDGNASLAGEEINLIVSDLSKLMLDGAFDGSIGYLEGIRGDSRCFGEVSENASDDWERLEDSAANFSHDRTGAYGVAATNESGKVILVWSDAFAADGSFKAKDGSVFWCVGKNPHEVEPVPVPVEPKISLRFVGGNAVVTVENAVRGLLYWLLRKENLNDEFDVVDYVEATGEKISFGYRTAGKNGFFSVLVTAEPLDD